MKPKSNIQFVLQRPLDDVKANLIQTMNMCMGMVENNQKVSLLIPVKIGFDEAEDKLNSIIKDYKSFFDVNFIKYKPIFKFFDEFNRFLNLYKHLDFSADYIFTRSPLIIIFCILKNQKIVYESHNSNFAKNKILNFIYLIIFKIIIRSKSFKLFITISNNLNNFWINKGFLTTKTFAFHDGTNLVEKSNIPHVKIPFDNKNLIFTYTGSLYIDRGIERIIRLAKEFKNCNFLVVGGPIEIAKKLKKECKNNSINNIFFTGPVPHRYVASYLFKSDILLALWSSKVPTINYCSPLKIFEYMASNKLIVADGYITIKEILIDNVNAIIVKPDNFASLKQSIIKIVNKKDLYLNLGRDNRNKIKLNYSWKKRCELILNKLN